MRYAAVVFDLDDTLYEERQFVQSGFRAVANWLAVKFTLSSVQVYDQLNEIQSSGNTGNTFDRWLNEQGLSDSASPGELVHVYRTHMPTLSLRPGADILIESLAKQNVALGIVTDGYLGVQRRKVESLRLVERFNSIVFSDEFGRSHWKPSTRPFTHVANLLGVHPRDSVYIGDNPTKDFVGCRKLGFSTIRLRCQNGLYAELEPACRAYAADHDISRLNDIQRILK